jgi:diacylglycerol kinase (ATP)
VTNRSTFFLFCYRKPASGNREIRSFPDWDDNAISGEHLWLATTASIDVCHAGDSCSVSQYQRSSPSLQLNLFSLLSQQKRGDRMRCSACKILAHSSCINTIMDRQDLACKPTFRDVGIRAYREQTKTHHHWVHRRTEKGKCKACSKVSLIFFSQCNSNIFNFIDET